MTCRRPLRQTQPRSLRKLRTSWLAPASPSACRPLRNHSLNWNDSAMTAICPEPASCSTTSVKSFRACGVSSLNSSKNSKRYPVIHECENNPYHQRRSGHHQYLSEHIPARSPRLHLSPPIQSSIAGCVRVQAVVTISLPSLSCYLNWR